MSSTTILERICHLFTADRGKHLDRISDALLNGTPQEPAHPMSDQELARAIREFHTGPVSDRTLAELSRRFAEVPRDG